MATRLGTIELDCPSCEDTIPVPVELIPDTTVRAGALALILRLNSDALERHVRENHPG